MGRSRLGRRLLAATNPATRGIGRADWRILAEAAAAHRFVQQRSCYVALVLAKGER
jgi:hypothetical protein